MVGMEDVMCVYVYELWEKCWVLLVFELENVGL